MNKIHRWLAVAATCAQATLPGFSAEAEDPVVELEKLEVTDVPIEENVMPNSRPFNSVFGSNLNILETPRNVTIISRAQLDDINISSVRDFSKLTSSSYTTTNFGAPANPTIRGQYADMFNNGERRWITTNGNGMPLNFNSVESVNIVKGPATAVFGPSFYVGGYADLITKRPFFDRGRGSASVTVGSYDVYKWTLDYGAPVSKTTAYRFSYSGENSKGYYYDEHRRSHALYGALTFRPSDRYELFVNAEFFNASYTENFGVNRVTQDLIDNDNYITGINNNPAALLIDSNGVPIAPYLLSFTGTNQANYFNTAGEPIALETAFVTVFDTIPGGAPAPVSDAQNSANVISGFPVTNRIVPGPTVKLNRRQRLLRPGDNSNGFMQNLQVIQTFSPSPDLQIVNNTYGFFIKRDTISSYYYSEILDPSWSLENRTEFRIKRDSLDLNAGFAVRYQRVKAYNNFFFEPASVWDVTKDRNFINTLNSVTWAGGAVEVPGWPGRTATPGVFNGDTNDSSALQAGPFAQAIWKANDKIQLFAGGRLDRVRIHGKDPLKPVFVASAEDTVTVTLPNYNLSVVANVAPELSTYVTYNFSRNYGGAIGNGGGFGQFVDTGGGNYRFLKDNLKQKSELIEAGAKANFLEKKLFAGASVFQQTRFARQQDGSLREFTYEGFEVEGNYQPSRSFYLTASYSYLDAVSDLPQFDVGNVAFYTGSGSLNDGANYAPLPGTVRYFEIDNGPGEYRVQGLPKNLVNLLATYRHESGFGVSAGLQWSSEVNVNVAGSLVIPSQINVDATLFYATPTWEVRLAILNATDENNWAPPNYVYGNESILAEPPIHGELTFKFNF